MKIRIGVGTGGASATPEGLAEVVTALDELGFDSLWLSEVLTGPVLDPVVGLAWAAASNPRLKLGTTMLLPGRNVLRLAKQLATLDVLCRGRLLVTLVPGLTYAPEREAIGLEPKRRGAFIDEALPLLRRFWAGETVSHDGPAGTFRDVTLSAAGATAAGGLARRHRARRAGALRPVVGRLVAVAVHARRGSRGTGRDRGSCGAGRTLDQSRALRRQHRLCQPSHRPRHRAHDGRPAPAGAAADAGRLAGAA